MINVTLLTSEESVKQLTSLSDNVESKYLLPAMIQAQEMGLKAIIGTTLMNKLKWCIENDAFRGAFSPTNYNDDYDSDGNPGANAQYRKLLGQCQFYLAYQTLVEVAMMVSYKVTNAGVIKTSDDNVANASLQEICSLRDYYTGKVDWWALELQNFLLNNKADYPELTDGDKHRIHAHLTDAASCGIFLGGARGRK